MSDVEATKKQEAVPVDQKQQQQRQQQQKKKKKKKAKKRVLKVPKGCRDYGPDECTVREKVLTVISDVFKKHGARKIETPVFELRELLLGQYGEDEKLVYDLQDQGGEICSLRYDLTVPFCRWMAQNSVQRIKKYQIARVYRRDAPNFKSGRYREFYQCDFDIAGEYSPMLPDAECVTILKEVLAAVDVGAFKIKMNHRKLLGLVFKACEIPDADFAAACSSVDKLDKLSWEKVRKELVVDKNISEKAADALAEYVKIKGEPRKVLEQLRQFFDAEEKELMDSLELLFDYLEAFGALDAVEFNLSLARGLGYYTGIIFEAVLTDTKVRLGSVGGGGRYDNLIGTLGNKQIPCVGMSVGIERLFTLIVAKAKGQKIPSCSVLVASVETSLVKERMALLKELWDMGISAEILLKNKPKIQAQLRYADNNNIPLVLIIGSDELQQGIVQLKDLRASTQVAVKRSELKDAINKLL